MSINLAGLTQARWERNAYLSCAILVSWEYLLQFSAEIELFWKQRWSVAKCLFLWSRYYGLAFNISNAVINLPLGCSKFFHWQNTGASLQVISTHLILELRLWAMYGSTRKVLLLFVLLTIGEAIAMGIVFGIPNQKTVGTNEPFKDVFICADADPLDGSHWVVYYWVAILVIETILLALAVRKAWEHRSPSGSNLMQKLTRESVFYFMTIFWVYLANLILWIINRITLNELLTAFAFVIPSLFANRLLIAVRSANYPDAYAEVTTLPTIRFIKRSRRRGGGGGGEETLNNTVELRTMPYSSGSGSGSDNSNSREVH